MGTYHDHYYPTVPSLSVARSVVRHSTRFHELLKPPTLKIGDKVTAIFMYKEGGTRKCLGTVASIDEGGQHSTIVYKDGDVEEHVSRAVITLMKSKLLDKSPEM